MPLVIDQKDLDRLPITIDPEIVSGTQFFVERVCLSMP